MKHNGYQIVSEALNSLQTKYISTLGKVTRKFERSPVGRKFQRANFIGRADRNFGAKYLKTLKTKEPEQYKAFRSGHSK